MPCRIIVTIFVVFFGTFGSISVQAVEKKTVSAVIILPFDADGAGKYSYLKESLRNMLTTRLAVRDGIRILDDSLSPKESAEVRDLKKQAPSPAIFARLHANYIVTGALSSRADGLNLHLIFYSAAGVKNPMNFTMSAENEEKILPSLDSLAQEIGDKVAGTPGPQKAETGAKEDTPKQQKSETSAAMAAFRTPHPERLYKTGIYAGGGIVGAEHGGQQASSQGVRRSAPISMKIVAMAVGDLDGDGVDEIVLAADGELLIYNFLEGRFVQVAKAPISDRLKINGMNLADLDKSGKKKLYISATEGTMVSSLVLAWDKVHGLQTLHKNIRWYLRPLEVPGEGLVLAGQEKGFEGNILVSPGIYELTMRKGSDTPQRGKKLSLPKSVNLFDFALADLNEDGKVETIAIDKNEKLSVYDQAGTLLWISDENFGGSTAYLGPSWTSPTMLDDKVFVPTRIIVTDVNYDKKKEIIIGRNQRGSYSYKFFKNSRSYNGGYISCMTWTGSAMTELWHTNLLDGMIADYSFKLGPQGTEARSGGGAGAKIPGMEKSSATLFVGQISDKDILDTLLQTAIESNVFAYDINIITKK